MGVFSNLGGDVGNFFAGIFGEGDGWQLSNAPDNTKELAAQKAAFEEEKKRRAMEANRTDLQASQAARLFFGQSTSNPKSDMTNDFLGL